MDKTNITGQKMDKEDKLIRTVIGSLFSDKTAKQFLSPLWFRKRKDSGISCTGFCGYASYAYYCLMDGKSTGHNIMKWISTDDPEVGHFWIQDPVGNIVDLTSDQYFFDGGFKHYEHGKPCAVRHTKKKQEFLQLVKNTLQSVKEKNNLKQQE